MGRLENSYWVKAEWDDEAKVWYTADSNVPGLATEADTVPALMDKLRVMVPELLQLNGHEQRAEVPVELVAHYAERVRLRV